MTPLISISDVSALLKVSKATVRRLVSAGELPCIRLSKNSPLRFDMRDLEKFVQERKA